MTKAAQGYNITATQLTTAEKSTNAKGTDKITFRVSTTVRGRQVERTVVAQGKAAAAISAGLRKNSEQQLRVLFDRAPDNDDGSQGGEFFTAIGRPLPKKAA